MIEKVILSVAIVVFACTCGYLLSKKYRKKKCFYEQMSEFNQRFIHEMQYYRRPIHEFVNLYTYKAAFQELLKTYLDFLQKGDLTIGFVYSCADLEFISKDEKDEIDDYFQMLGKGDSASQKAFFSSASDWLNARKKNAEDAYKRYGNLYMKLGFLCGLFIVVLII